VKEEMLRAIFGMKSELCKIEHDENFDILKLLGLLPGGASESTLFSIIKLVQNNLVTVTDQTP
jgi:hypothetical protein